MSYLALIINPDKTQRGIVKDFLGAKAEFESFEFTDETTAIAWMNKHRRPVDFIFSSWDINHIRQGTIVNLRENEYSKSAFIYPIASNEDLDWIKTIFGTPELIDGILIKPFRSQTFTQRVQQVLKADLGSKPSVLMVEDNEGARETVRGYLKHFGFTQIFEAANGKEGLSVLEQHHSEIGLIVSDWEMPLMNGLQFLKKVRETPGFVDIPFVMITSQTSIDQIKMIQAAEFSVNGYLQKPFKLQLFQGEMDRIFTEIEKGKRAEASVLEARTLMASGDVSKAIRVLAEAILKLPDSSALYEAIGDAYWESHSSGNEQNYRVRAAEAYEKALKFQPKKGLVIKCFEAYASLSRMSDAIRTLKLQLNTKGFDDELRTHLGKVYLRCGEYKLAAEELKRALTVNPDNLEAQSLYQVATSLKKGVAK